MKDAPSLKEQVNALVTGTKFELVCEHLGKSKLKEKDYDKVFTVTRRELLEYLPNNYTIDQVIRTKKAPRDGFYALKGIYGWTTFIQEREIRFNQEKVESEDKVWEQYVSIALGYSS